MLKKYKLEIPGTLSYHSCKAFDKDVNYELQKYFDYESIVLIRIQKDLLKRGQD